MLHPAGIGSAMSFALEGKVRMQNEPNAPLLKWTPYLLSVLRIVAAIVYIGYGTQKFFGFPEGPASPLFSLLGAAGVIETFGGLLMLLGLLTRPVGFVLSGEMAVAYWLNHAPRGLWLFPSLNGGAPAVLFCFIYLYLATAGGGPWSLDALLVRASEPGRTD